MHPACQLVAARGSDGVDRRKLQAAANVSALCYWGTCQDTPSQVDRSFLMKTQIESTPLMQRFTCGYEGNVCRLFHKETLCMPLSSRVCLLYLQYLQE